MAASFELVDPPPGGPGAGRPPPGPRSLPVRIVQLFVSPGELFERLAERPVWLDALIALVAINLAVAFLVPEEITRRIFEQFVPAGADPAQLDAMIEGARTRGRIGAVVWTPIGAAIVSGLVLLAYNVVLGGEGRFRQLFSATLHAYFVLTLGGLLTLGLMFLGSNQAVLSPALLLPDLGDGFLARWLGLVNVFAIWTCAILGVAVAAIYPGRSAVGATVYLLVLYAGWTALNALFLGVALSASA